MRPSGRKTDQMRKVSFERNFSKHAEGSCLVKFGDTHVLVHGEPGRKDAAMAAQFSGKGWVTAEYGMLPRATGDRMKREAATGKQGGRTQEIQRLIGRSLRAVVDLKELGERQITLDCDVIQADGGTRTASITGAWIALLRLPEVDGKPQHDQGRAGPEGPYRGDLLRYLRQPAGDRSRLSRRLRSAETDANFVMTGSGGIVEIQGTAEGTPFSEEEFGSLMALAKNGIAELVEMQKQAIG
jgi:ribonuclease PH